MQKRKTFRRRGFTREERIGVAHVYEDVVAGHASRGADSKLSNALDDGIFFFDHHVFIIADDQRG